jgi:hypothetical protein
MRRETARSFDRNSTTPLSPFAPCSISNFMISLTG